MNSEFNHPSKGTNKGAYRVPEGYFDDITKQIMSRLPEKAPERKTISFIRQFSPWLSAAAVIAGVGIFYNIFFTEQRGTDEPQPNSSTFIVRSDNQSQNRTAVTDEDQEYLEYIEKQYTDYLYSNELGNLE